MFKVTYTYRGNNSQEAFFKTYEKAKMFFFSLLKKNDVTKAEILIK